MENVRAAGLEALDEGDDLVEESGNVGGAEGTFLNNLALATGELGRVGGDLGEVLDGGHDGLDDLGLLGAREDGADDGGDNIGDSVEGFARDSGGKNVEDRGNASQADSRDDGLDEVGDLDDLLVWRTQVLEERGEEARDGIGGDGADALDGGRGRGGRCGGFRPRARGAVEVEEREVEAGNVENGNVDAEEVEGVRLGCGGGHGGTHDQRRERREDEEGGELHGGRKRGVSWER